LFIDAYDLNLSAAIPRIIVVQHLSRFEHANTFTSPDLRALLIRRVGKVTGSNPAPYTPDYG